MYIFCFSEHKVLNLTIFFLKMFFPVPIWRHFHKNVNCRNLPVTECAKENVTHVSVALAFASFLQVRCFVFEQLMAAADLLLWICLKKYIYINWQLSYTIWVYYTSTPYSWCQELWRFFTANTVTASQTCECFWLNFHICTGKQ